MEIDKNRFFYDSFSFMKYKRDSIQSILYSAKQFLTGTLFSRVTGLLRDIAMAAAFGTHESVSAFFVAFRFSHLFRRLFGEGALQSAFIPEFEKLRNEDPKKAFRFFQNLSIVLFIFLTVLILIVMGGISAVLAFGEIHPNNREILQLTLILMPSLLFICLYGLNSSLLQCQKSYFIPSVAPAGFNLVWIAGIACLYSFSAPAAMPWLASFVILACICQWGITVPKILFTLKNQDFFKWHCKELIEEVKIIIKPLCLGIIGVGASQINNALDSVFARYASLEGPAYLWYAIRIQQLPLALFGIALSGAILPPLSRAAKEENLANFHYYLRFGLLQIVLLMLPITFGIIFLGNSCVRLLYGHGDFDALSISETAKCLFAYGLGLVPMAAILILAPAFYARKNYLTPALGSLYSILMNICLNAILIFGVGYGPASVALATSISAWFNLFYLLWSLGDTIYSLGLRTLLFSIGKIFAASLAACFSVQYFLSIWKILPPHSFWMEMRQFLLEASLFLTCLWIFCWVLKIKEFFNLFFYKNQKNEES